MNYKFTIKPTFYNLALMNVGLMVKCLFYFIWMIPFLRQRFTIFVLIPWKIPNQVENDEIFVIFRL